MANALAREHDDLTVMIEEPEPRGAFLRRRARRLGLTTVAGQVLFALCGRLAARRASRRLSEILVEAGLDEVPLPEERVRRIGNANAPETREMIAGLDPEVVVVNGTRILSRALLETIKVPVLNLHTGITPHYRGVHGGYWALASGDPGRCGVTVHLVDAGVDTGAVVSQAPIVPGPEDSYFTYAALQFAAGVPLMLDAVRRARTGELRAEPVQRGGRQFYHPTLWGYIATGLKRGVW